MLCNFHTDLKQKSRIKLLILTVYIMADTHSSSENAGVDCLVRNNLTLSMINEIDEGIIGE